MCARAGRRGDKWRMVGERIRGRCCVLGFGRNSRVWGRTYGPRPIYRRRTGGSSFCPSVDRLSCTTNGLPYPQRGERRRTVNWGCGPRWGREDARGGGGRVGTPRCPAWLRNSHWSPRADSRNLVLPTMPD